MSIGIGVYAKNSKETVKLYCDTFGLELGYHVLNDDGNYFHSELMKDGEPFIAVAESNDENLPNGVNFSYTNPVELGYTASSEEEFHRVFTALKEGGKVVIDITSFPWSPLAAVVMDPYGVRWYITLPQHRPAE